MRRFVQATAIALAAWFLAGCATPPPDWQNRVGVYTYDQAVMDYGLPLTVTLHANGSTMDEWMADNGRMVVTPGPYIYATTYYPSLGVFYGPVVGPVTPIIYPSRYLQLEFSPDGTLKGWKDSSN